MQGMQGARPSVAQTVPTKINRITTLPKPVGVDPIVILQERENRYVALGCVKKKRYFFFLALRPKYRRICLNKYPVQSGAHNFNFKRLRIELEVLPFK